MGNMKQALGYSLVVPCLLQTQTKMFPTAPTATYFCIKQCKLQKGGNIKQGELWLFLYWTKCHQSVFAGMITNIKSRPFTMLLFSVSQDKMFGFGGLGKAYLKGCRQKRQNPGAEIWGSNPRRAFVAPIGFKRYQVHNSSAGGHSLRWRKSCGSNLILAGRI